MTHRDPVNFMPVVLSVAQLSPNGSSTHCRLAMISSSSTKQQILPHGKFLKSKQAENLTKPVIRPMEIDVTIEYITSVEPLPELLPLVQSLNPDFFFAFTGGRLSESATSFLEWIKKFQPLPAHLVHLWEDYTFMAFRSQGHTAIEQWLPDFVADSAQLIRILCVYKVFPDMSKLGTGTRFLLQIRLLLGMSWEELRVPICALRVILGNDRTQLHRLLTANLNDTVWGAFDSKGLLIELAQGGLRLLETMINSEEPFEWVLVFLEGVSRIELASRRTGGLGGAEDLYNALEWLKYPTELIARFVELPERALNQDGWWCGGNNVHRLEKGWTDWRNLRIDSVSQQYSRFGWSAASNLKVGLMEIAMF
ncbi:hypothetical protein B0H13DRAFT_1884374 [Mycena leptocephala]|nr:hypothetical protein B0H13DRAFT_1884374 [Mycena leptocephala]